MLSKTRTAGTDPDPIAVSTLDSSLSTRPPERPVFVKSRPDDLNAKAGGEDDASVGGRRVRRPEAPSRRKARLPLAQLGDLHLVPPRRDHANHSESLLADLESVKQGVKAQSTLRLVPAPVEASYAEACGLRGGFQMKLGERQLSGSLHAEWIEIQDGDRVEEDHAHSSYGGDKIHLSVNRAQMDEAFPIVVGHLCAAGTPF